VGRDHLKNGRVEQSNFNNYRVLRMNEAPTIEVHLVRNLEPPGGSAAGTSITGRPRQRGFAATEGGSGSCAAAQPVRQIPKVSSDTNVQ